MAHRHFEGATHVAAYAKYRPLWTKNIVDRIIEYLHQKLPAPYDRALDVGCGSGQFTHLLETHFASVTGIDISDNQIEQAKNKNSSKNVTFKKGSGEDFPIDDRSVDLVTCAQAAHWFDLDKFYAETHRVLKPNGCVALLGYALPVLDHNPQGPLMSKYVREADRVMYEEKCWQPGNDHCYSNYANIHLPYEDYIRDDSLSMDIKLSVEHFIGYVSSWSGYVKYMEKYPDSDILEKLQENILKTMGEDASVHSMLHVAFPIFMLLGRKPGAQER